MVSVFDFLKFPLQKQARRQQLAETMQVLLQEELGDRIPDLSVEYDEKLFTLRGTCDSFSTMKRAITLVYSKAGVSRIRNYLTIKP